MVTTVPIISLDMRCKKVYKKKRKKSVQFSLYLQFTDDNLNTRNKYAFDQTHFVILCVLARATFHYP